MSTINSMKKLLVRLGLRFHNLIEKIENSRVRLDYHVMVYLIHYNVVMF